MHVQPSHHPIAHRWMRTFALVCLALLTSGCGKLVYDRLDTLGAWWIGNLVTLDPEQRDDVRSWLARTHEWHRASELGRYADFLHDLAERAATPLDREGFEQMGRQVETFGDTLVEQAAPEGARLILRLTSAQVAELEANLDERGQKRARESEKRLAKGNWQAERARDLRKQVKRWTGAVTKEQAALLETAAAQFEPTAREWLDSQRQWRRAMRDTLAARDAPDAEQQVLALLKAPESHWTADYRAKNERNRRRSLDLMVALDQSLTPAQREHLQRELKQLAARLDSLRRS